MQITLNGEPIGDLASFLTVNADGISETEADTIRDALVRGEIYRGGGGAAPGWQLAPHRSGRPS